MTLYAWVRTLRILHFLISIAGIRTTMQLQDEFSKPSKQRRFLLCHSYVEQGIMKVKLTGKQNPGRVKSILGDNVEVVLVSN